MATTPAGPSMETAHEFEEDDSDDEFDELIDHYYERRNILILNAQDSIIAGLEQRGTFFVRNVYRWLKTLYLLPEDDGWFIRCLSDGQIVPCNSHILFPIGSFHIVSKDSLVLSPSRKITHPLYRCLVNLDHSRPTYLDEDVFQEICRRDQRCLITGWNLPDPRRQFKDDFFCARIFPLMPPSRFADPLVQELLPGSAESAEAFAQLMQSPSNAFICSYMPCEVFNAYWFSIDVDDDYRIVQFVDCQNWNVPVSGSGKLLVDSWSEHATRPSDALLRAHFQQALLRWLHNDPAEHQEYLTATKLAFRIQDQEITSGDSAWIQEPGKSVFEAYIAQQLVGCCAELGNTFQDRFTERALPTTEPLYMSEVILTEEELAERPFLSPIKIIGLNDPSPPSSNRGRVYGPDSDRDWDWDQDSDQDSTWSAEQSQSNEVD